jgi:hypothetical protein
MRIPAVLGPAFLVLSVSAAEAVGQGARQGVGVQVGYSRTDLGGPDAAQITARQGALTGIYLHRPFGRVVSLRPEVLFSLKGGRTETPEGLVVDIELAYLEFPLLGRVSVPAGRFRPVAFAGPAVAFQIGCDFEFVTPAQPEQEFRVTCGQDEVTIVRQVDYGVVAGAGVEGLWPRAALSVEVRYTSGLRSVFNDVEIRNRAFGLLFAITF